MSDIWAPVVAALGAAVLTALSGFGLIVFQRWLGGRQTRRDAAVAAYSEMLAASMHYLLRAQAVGLVVRLRSGVAEGFNVLLGLRKSVDPFDLYQWMTTDLRVVNTAWSHVYVVGSQSGVDAADRLLDACADFMSAAMAMDQTRRAVARAVRGERPSKRQEEELQSTLRRVAVERVNLARVARSEGGRETVLFALDRAHAAAAGSNDTAL